MSTNVTVAGTLTGTSPKGPIGPVSINLALQNQRGAMQLEFAVDPADVARVIALPAEGSAQSMFLLCADQEFTFTINGGAEVYTLKPGLPPANGQGPTGFIMLLSTPFVSSIEVTGGTIKATGYMIRVVES